MPDAMNLSNIQKKLTNIIADNTDIIQRMYQKSTNFFKKSRKKRGFYKISKGKLDEMSIYSIK